MIVIDASALTDFLLGRPAAVDALEAELQGHEQEPLHAPELIEPEVLNALRRLALTSKITEERAAAAVVDLAVLRMIRYPHAPLRGRVWELRHGLTSYDATYLALAEAITEAVLATSDRGLARRARMEVGDDRVRYVG